MVTAVPTLQLSDPSLLREANSSTENGFNRTAARRSRLTTRRPVNWWAKFRPWARRRRSAPLKPRTALSRLAGAAGQRALRDPAPLFDLMLAEHGRSRADHDRGAGQAAGRGRGEIAYGAALHRMVRRRRQARSTATPFRRTCKGRRIMVIKEPVGVCRRHHAMEFPSRDDHAQSGAGAGGGLHRA